MSAHSGMALPKHSIRGHSADLSSPSRHTSIRILLADDYAIMRNALRALLEQQANIEVVVPSHRARGRADNADGVFPSLSPREHAIAQLIVEGYRTNVIARLLHISIPTVGTHRRNLLIKLRISSVAKLTKFALREGLTTLNSQPTLCAS